jgi:hypothetical protein
LKRQLKVEMDEGWLKVEMKVEMRSELRIEMREGMRVA